jgi:TonB family protein
LGPLESTSHKNIAPLLAMLKTIISAVFTALLVGSSVAKASADDWPTKIVKLEELRATTKFRLFVPEIVVKGRVTGPSILKVHVAADGLVARTALLSSCGNSDLDEASLHGMREMKFEPYIVDEGPTDVSLIVPIYIPKNWGRRD